MLFKCGQCVGNPVEFQQSSRQIEFSLLPMLSDTQLYHSGYCCQQEARTAFGCSLALPVSHLPSFPGAGRKQLFPCQLVLPLHLPPNFGHHQFDQSMVWFPFLTVSRHRTVELFQEPLWLKLQLELNALGMSANCQWLAIENQWRVT